MISFVCLLPTRVARILLTVAATVGVFVPSWAQQVWDIYGEPEKGITVMGIVKGEATGSAGGSVKIYRNGSFYQEVFAGSTGKYEADLPFDDDYELEFSIPGCVTKRIKVETNVPTDVQDQPIEPLAFNMSLPKATNGPLDEAYKVPVSRLFFDKTVDDFNRDMVAEEAFRNTLKAKQAEHKRWLDEQKAEEEAEKQRLRDEELARKKAEEAARAEEARQKAEAAARAKAEADARAQAQAAAAQKAKDEAARIAQEEAMAKQLRDAEQRKLDELRRKQVSDSLYRENERMRLEKAAAAAEAERKKKEEQDKALWEKLNDQQAALDKLRQKEIQDSLFRENDKIRLAKETADREVAERQKQEADEKLYQARMAKEAQDAEAERRRQELSDSLYKDNERIRQEAEAQSSGTSYGGAGRSVFYQTEEKSPASPRDNGAWERTANWKRKRETKKMELQEREQLRADQARRIRGLDIQRRQEAVQRQISMEERRRMVAERDRLRELDAENTRQARLKESLGKEIVVLVAYSAASSNRTHAKFYGYVNFGDGKGPLELTESEYRQLSERFNKVYNSKP